MRDVQALARVNARIDRLVERAKEVLLVRLRAAEERLDFIETKGENIRQRVIALETKEAELRARIEALEG